jgi:hypothetical protein
VTISTRALEKAVKKMQIDESLVPVTPCTGRKERFRNIFVQASAKREDVVPRGGHYDIEAGRRVASNHCRRKESTTWNAKKTITKGETVELFQDSVANS